MNKRKKYLLHFAFLLSFSSVHAQFDIYNLPDTNFWDIRDSFYADSSNFSDSLNESGILSNFKRWEQFWLPRIGTTGSFSRVADAVKNYANAYNSNVSSRNSSSQTSSFIDDWRPLGPIGKVHDNNTFALTSSGNGQMNRIEFDGNNVSLR